jgi:hypothetical protein
MENKYKTGEVVCERIHPTQKLIISRFLNGIYYAKIMGQKARKELVFLEKDIKAISSPAESFVDTRRDWQFSFYFPTLFRLWKAVTF